MVKRLFLNKKVGILIPPARLPGVRLLGPAQSESILWRRKVDQHGSQDANCPKSGKNAEDAQDTDPVPDFLRHEERNGHDYK